MFLNCLNRYIHEVEIMPLESNHKQKSNIVEIKEQRVKKDMSLKPFRNEVPYQHQVSQSIHSLSVQLSGRGLEGFPLSNLIRTRRRIQFGVNHVMYERVLVEKERELSIFLFAKLSRI